MSLELRFTSLAHGGEAVARLPDGLVVFVPFALPGERALVEVGERRRGYARGRLLRLLEPAPERCAPRCRHFGSCGGCQLQHLGYAHQLQAKRAVLAEQLQRLGSLETAGDPGVVQPTVPSPSPWAYRNSLQLHWGPDGRPGFKGRSSGRVVAISECHLPEPPIGELWPRLSPGLLRSLGPAGGRLALRCGLEGPVLVVAGAAPPGSGASGGPATEASGGAPLTLGPSGGLVPAPPLRYRIGPHSFRVSPGSFFQVNSAGAAALVEQVLRAVPAAGVGTVVETHCGVGLLSRFLAERAERLVCVELSPSACADFRCNLGGLRSVRLVQERAGSALAGLKGPCDLLVADPPRAGLERRLIDALPRLAPRSILYVSCDPATLARDARALTAVGYRLARATPVDLFPQTYHVETVSLWRR